MARAYQALLAAPPFEPTTFANDGGYDELVLVRDIPVHSVCEHHFLPFSGVAHVAYLPGERLVGLSKLARVVEHLARRPQVQERLTCHVSVIERNACTHSSRQVRAWTVGYAGPSTPTQSPTRRPLSPRDYTVICEEPQTFVEL